LKGLFICGIHTGIGKTVASAILVEALKADYWKPVQTGSIDHTDSDFIRENASHHQAIHPEAYKFREPVSPHYAAALENSTIDVQKIVKLDTPNPVIVESAGGVFSPLSDIYLMVDLAQYLELPIILISMNYLGSINHTLLSIEALQTRNVSLAGIIFNGQPDPASEAFILQYSGIEKLGSIPLADPLSRSFISEQAKNFESLYELVG
jgi:dethiobiotin synthetase